MKQPLILTALVFGQVACRAQYSFSTDFSQSQDFSGGVGSTGWVGAYGGNNPSSTFASSSGHLTISDRGGHWEGSLISGHLLYVSVSGDFTMQGSLSSLSSSTFATAGIGAFDPSITTGSPTVTWLGAYYKGFDGEIGLRTVVGGGGGDFSPYNLANSGTLSLDFKMTRVGDVFTEYYSVNGVDFTEINSVTMNSLPETVDVGIWDGSYTGNTSTSVFDSFSVTTTPVPEPSLVALAGLGIAGLLAFRRK